MEKLVKEFPSKTICKIIVLINQISLNIQMFNKIKLYKIINSSVQIMPQIICHHNSSDCLYLSDITDSNTNDF